MPASIAILSLFFIMLGVGVVVPAIQNIAEAFPQVPFTTVLLISTLPSLTMIPASVAAGGIADKFGYRPLTIVGVLLFLLGGTLPYVQNDFAMILVSRGIFGVGLGIITPIGPALVLKLYEGQKRANMLGIGNAFTNIGGIAMQMGGAVLCTMGWQNTFLMHLIAAVTLLLVITMLPEPEEAAEPQTGAASKGKMPMIVWAFSFLCGFVVMLEYPALLNMSTIIISAGLGTAASVGVVVSMLTVGGMMGGALFGKVFQVSGRFSIGIGIAVLGVGLGMVNFAESLVLLSVGVGVMGLGFFWIIPAAMMELGKNVEPARTGMATGFLMAAINVGLFIAPYHMALLAKVSGNTDIRFPVFFGMIATLVTPAATIISKLKPVAASEIKELGGPRDG